ncbi:MAG: CARDB domain-containing protein [Verrucomicrobiota bacterium]
MTAIKNGWRSAFITSVFLAGLLATASVLSAAVTASITPSRTSGVAPLAVNFDATGTTSSATTRPFHDVYYSWSYGDAGSGTWSTNDKSKNHDTGPIGGHVFETPGTYTVTLSVKDSAGSTDTETVSITVTDPNTVFSGTNTICISTSADFTGAPSGAQQVTTTSWTTVTSYLGTGRRVLLKRGHSWNHNNNKKSLNFAGPGILGAFGSGARPVIRFVSTDTNTHDGRKWGSVFWFGDQTPNTFQDFRMMDIEVDGDGYDRRFIWSEGACHNITMLRVYMHDGGEMISLPPNIYNVYNAHANPIYHGHTLPSGIAIVDTEYQNMVGDGGVFNGHHIAYIGIHRSLFMGNVWNNTEAGEHVLRLPFVQRTLIAHNELTNCRATKNLIKLHAHADTEPLVSPPGNGQSKYVTIADNYFFADVGSWYVSTGPQNDTSAETVQDIILERNHVQFGFEATTAFDLRGSDHTVRNNTVVMTGSQWAGTVAVFAKRGIEPVTPTNNRVYNNSAFRSDAENFVFVNAQSTSTNTTVRNNLGSAPSAPTASMVTGSGSVTQSNNLVTNTPDWVNASPTTALHFELATGSSSIDAGTSVPVFDDYEEAPRPSGAAIDRGAFEFISLPDVVVTSVSYSNGTFSCVVQNQGGSATPAGIDVAVAYLVDGTYRTWGAMAVPPLAAGASVNIGTNGGLYHIPNGAHTITAFIDDINRFPESNEGNNQLSDSITVSAPIYQGENAAFAGGAGAQSTNSGYLGTGYANFQPTNSTATFNNVYAGSGGAKTLVIRFALGGTTSRTGQLIVNGTTTNITFNTSGGWTTWTNKNVAITLNSGTANTIQFKTTGQDLASVDQITIQ